MASRQVSADDGSASKDNAGNTASACTSAWCANGGHNAHVPYGSALYMASLRFTAKALNKNDENRRP